MRPASVDAGWGVDFANEAGSLARLDLCGRFTTYLESAPLAWTLWDPLRVAPGDRNVAHIIDNRRFRDVDVVKNFYAPLGIDRLGHMTLVASAGPRLLGWIGVWRDQPYGARDRARLAGQASELRERLTHADELSGAGVSWSLLDAALEGLPRAAFVLQSRGRIEHANSAGRSLLDQGARSLTRRLAGTLNGVDPEWQVSPIRHPSGATLHLVVQRAGGSLLEACMVEAQQRWRLTPSSMNVMRLVAKGFSTKEIARSLRRSEHTVELHVSDLLRRAGVSSRARLLAQFWNGGREPALGASSRISREPAAQVPSVELKVDAAHQVSARPSNREGSATYGKRPTEQPLPPALARIAAHVAEGLSDKQIAERLRLPMSTVRTYVQRCYRRLRVSNRVELTRVWLG